VEKFKMTRVGYPIENTSNLSGSRFICPEFFAESEEIDSEAALRYTE
jgi:hypothetical protein